MKLSLALIQRPIASKFIGACHRIAWLTELPRVAGVAAAGGGFSDGGRHGQFTGCQSGSYGGNSRYAAGAPAWYYRRPAPVKFFQQSGLDSGPT